MTNSALALFELFSSWRTNLEGNQNSVANSRRLEEPEGIVENRVGMSHLMDTIRGLDELENAGVQVRVYKRYVAHWTRMLMSYPLGWYTQTGAEEAFPSSAMDQLEALSSWFEVHKPRLRPEAKGTLHELVDDTRSLLRDDDSISNELRLYLQRLISEIDAALNDEELGESFDYASATERLWVGLFAASAQSADDEQKSRWSNLARRFLIPTTIGVLSGLPAAAATLGAAAIS